MPTLGAHPKLELRDPPAASALERVMAVFGDRLAREYVEFLRHHDGAAGFIGPSYVNLFGIDELIAASEQRAHPSSIDDCVVFGTNGAGEAFVFDHRGDVMMVPWIGDPADAIPQGRFAEFLQRLHDNTIFAR